ncbi:proteoglycan 4b isoform X2 [Paramisgurnus dabryanus]|uniref:proteoglycan 4b isoform X2 n=1 Tax=Paramisgurnus dabryanus TaxID=90735 RepID=UPI0031F40FEB
MDKYLFFFLLFACASLSHSDSKSCNGRCGQGYYKGSLCQCDYECLGLNECCTDFKSLCTTKNSCKGRCGEPFERGNTCHCDNDCITYNQCCPDYESFCLMEESSNEDMTNYEGEDLETPVDESASAFLPAEATPSKAKCPPTIKPAAEPATTTPTAEPANTKPTAEPATTKLTAEPATTTPTAEPATTTPTAEPATTTPAAEPATTTPAAEPAITTPAAEPTTTTPTAEPATTKPTAEPATTKPTAEPATTKPTAEPATTTPTEGSPSTTSTEGSPTTTKTPTEGLLTTTPTEGSPTTTKTPTEGSPTTTPTESLTTKRPKEGSPTTPPTESLTTKRPKEGSLTTTPTESPTTTTPTEGPTTTKPKEVPAKGPTNKPVTKPFKPSLENNDKKDKDSELYQADDYDTNLCSGRPVSGLTTLRNGTIVVFRGHYFWTLDRNRNPDPPQLITSVWGIPSPIDTVYTRCNCLGKTYFFKGNNYWRFENDVMDPDFPKPISEGFGRISHITAALSMPQYRSRRESVIFFRRGGKAQTYTYQVTPDCGKRPMNPGIGLRNRYRRGTDSALGTVITISKTWRGFPTTVTSAVSVPSRVKEGYKYYVFSQGNSHSIKMERDKPVILKPANSQKENTANSFFKCPKSDKD